MSSELKIRYTDLIKSQLDFLCKGDNKLENLQDEELDIHCSFMEIIEAFDTGSTIIERIKEVTRLTHEELTIKCLKPDGISDVINTVYCFEWWLPKEISCRLSKWFEKTIRSQL